MRTVNLAQPTQKLPFAARFRSGLKTAISGRDGQAILETAIVLPTFCLLLGGIFIFAMTLTSYLSMTLAMGQATRYAAVHSLNSLKPATTSSISQMITSQTILLPGFYITNVSTTYTPSLSGSSNTNYPGSEVYISVSFYGFLQIPYFRGSFSGTRTMYRMVTQ